ncbi:MAG: NAD(+) synthase [Erysipelotrichaceae bacterium]
MLNIALGQIEVKAGKPSENFKMMEAYIQEAKANGVDLIIFSELCISGYLLSDLYYNQYYLQDCFDYNEKIKALSDGIGIIWGNVNLDSIVGVNKGRDGRSLRTNCAFFAYNQAWVSRGEDDRFAGYYVKHLYPDYRFFDDSRYFMSISELALYDEHLLADMGKAFVFKGHRIGVEICEDLFSDDYALNLTKHYQKDCDYIVNLSCSPYTIGKEDIRKKQIQTHFSSVSKANFIYVNNVGMQNNGKNVLTFDGNSSFYDASGNLVSGCNDHFNPELKIIDDHAPQHFEEDKLLRALVYGIQKFDEQMFHKKVKWVIGLSGGLDSSLSAALLTMALGPQRIVGYNMATSYNSLKTKDNAQTLADGLGIALKNGAIESLVDACAHTLQHDFDYPKEQITPFVMENVQARTRGHLLSAFAAMEQGVIVNNGNKVEVALGYCTLYGDSIGALSVLADLTKVQLFDLAHKINALYQKEIIPTRLLPQVSEQGIEWEMPPSAELKEAQLDPMKWFYHDMLIEQFIDYPNFQFIDLMKAYADGSIYEQEIGRWIRYYGLDDPKAFIDDLEWIMSQIKKSVFKRIQMPPILTVSNGAFGFDYRESQIDYELGETYKQLKEQILQKAL